MKNINNSITNRLAIGIKPDMELTQKIKVATKTEFLSKVKLLLNNLFGVYKLFAANLKNDKMEIEQAIICLNNIIDNINLESEEQLNLIEANIFEFNSIAICKTNNISCTIENQRISPNEKSTTLFNPSSVVLQINQLNSNPIEYQLDASKAIIDNIKESAMTGNFKHTLSPQLHVLLSDDITYEKNIEHEISSSTTGGEGSCTKEYLQAFKRDVLRSDYIRHSVIKESGTNQDNFEDKFNEDFVKYLSNDKTTPYDKHPQLIRFKTMHSQKATTSMVSFVIASIYTGLFAHPCHATVRHDELKLYDDLLDYISNKYTILCPVRIPSDNKPEEVIEIATVSVQFSGLIDTSGKVSSRKFGDLSITVSNSDLSLQNKIKLFSGYNQIKNQINILQNQFNVSQQRITKYSNK